MTNIDSENESSTSSDELNLSDLMENPVVERIVEYLSTSFKPLMHGRKHVGYEGTRVPIEYDYHMPPWLQLDKLEHFPELSSQLKENLIVKNLGRRNFVKNETTAILDAVTHTKQYIRDLVPREAVGESCVKNLQRDIHKISCPLATLSCFDIADTDIDQFRSVFGPLESSESETKADLLVGCRPRVDDEPEEWAFLEPSVTQPKNLRDEYFTVLLTEEYKNIRSGHPRTILGIYVIMWCLQQDHLEKFWPELECSKCPAFKKSHRAADDETIEADRPFDAPNSLPNPTDLVALRKEIDRLLDVVDTYDAALNVPATERTARNPQPSEPAEDSGESSEELLDYTDILERATIKASDDLNLPESIKNGLFTWVMNAAYILIQVWAQMVRHNGTVARLTCHNIGVIVTRHREKQTMTVSNFLEHTDAPLLHATALTVYAYNDAVKRHDEHETEGKPLWEEDPYRPQPKGKARDPDTDDDEEASQDNSDDGGSGRDDGGSGSDGGGGGTRVGGNQGGGNEESGRDKQRRERDERAKKREGKQDAKDDQVVDVNVSPDSLK
ncbi:hypothetical protein C8R43DRAFT_997434 [Mycena crocata]|nr:hypothetical protein C8R43DRAFT_997434 [Mycena crocata]